MLRWLAANLRTLILAFVLALAVWVSAVTAADPDEVQAFPRPIQIEIVGQDAGLVISGNYPQQVDITLRAPRSVWEQLTADEQAIHAVVDLAGLAAGTHTVDVRIQIALRPVRLESQSPAAIELTLEPLVTRTLPVELALSGVPAVGYQAGEALIEPAEAVISGPQSLVNRIDRVLAPLDLTGARQNVALAIPLEAADGSGSRLAGVTIHPENAQVSLTIVQLGGYRNVGIKVVTRGQPASGYSVTSVTSTPLVVTVFSEDAQLVSALPGAVETAPLYVNGASADIETRLTLNLPEGVTLIGEQTVLVQVGISAIESSHPISNRPVTVNGLPAGLKASISPDTVDVILFGPLPVLDKLSPADVHIVVDVTGLTEGTYQLNPTVEIMVEDIRVESILPATIEVIITKAAAPTP